jgi:beta-lactamase superfamily II metal-dependent hydrolase
MGIARANVVKATHTHEKNMSDMAKITEAIAISKDQVEKANLAFTAMQDHLTILQKSMDPSETQEEKKD